MSGPALTSMDSGLSMGSSQGSEDLCPQCQLPFDKGKKRRLIDACGHERCYSCLFQGEDCPVCADEVYATRLLAAAQHGRPPPGDNAAAAAAAAAAAMTAAQQSRPKLKTNGHFTATMQGRGYEDAMQMQQMQQMPRSQTLGTLPPAPPPPSSKGGPASTSTPSSSRKHRFFKSPFSSKKNKLKSKSAEPIAIPAAPSSQPDISLISSFGNCSMTDDNYDEMGYAMPISTRLHQGQRGDFHGSQDCRSPQRDFHNDSFSDCAGSWDPNGFNGAGSSRIVTNAHVHNAQHNSPMRQSQSEFKLSSSLPQGTLDAYYRQQQLQLQQMAYNQGRDAYPGMPKSQTFGFQGNGDRRYSDLSPRNTALPGNNRMYNGYHGNGQGPQGYPVQPGYPPTADTAKNDLELRLGLLLGDQRGQSPQVPLPGGPLPRGYRPGDQRSFRGGDNQSVSSLNSSEFNAPEWCESPLNSTGGSVPLTHSLLNLRSRVPSANSLVSLRVYRNPLVHQHHRRASSCSGGPAMRFTPNPGFSTNPGFSGAKDNSGDSLGSLMSLGSMMSSASQSMHGRPHSINTSSPGQVEDLFCKPPPSARRNQGGRHSARASLLRMNYKPPRAPQLYLRTINFQVVRQSPSSDFVGREWVYRDMHRLFFHPEETDNSRGIVISGVTGSGKTAIMEQLITLSCHGDAQGSVLTQNVQHNGYFGLRALSDQVVAYHYCQADYNITCMLADFVHNLSAQLVQAPHLTPYRDYLVQNPSLQMTLCIKECIRDPSVAFMRGIVEPLITLQQAGKLGHEILIMIVDSLNEAEFHRPDDGQTLAGFLSRHLLFLPIWMKVLVSVRTALLEITQSFPYHHICLNRQNAQDSITKDVTDYIQHRVEKSEPLKANIGSSGVSQITKFTNHLVGLSQGSMLFVKLVLDLIQNGNLVVKSSNYKILPQNLAEVYLLLFNLKFPSQKSFEKVCPILNVCLASLYPLTRTEIHEAVNSGYVTDFITKEEFEQRLEIVKSFLLMRKDGTFMYFHPSFREWLYRRDEKDHQKFLCDMKNSRFDFRTGHALLAFRLTRVEKSLSPDKTVELGHHILKAHIYKTQPKNAGASSRDLQAYWMLLSSADLSAALISPRNLFCPNAKVSRLILLAGANPNTRTDYSESAPVLAIMAKLGYREMVSLLLEFGANPDAVNDSGKTALFYAAAHGKRDVCEILVSNRVTIGRIDKNNQCALVLAAFNGRIETVQFLTHLDWRLKDKVTADWSAEGHVTKRAAIQQALVAAATAGHVHILEYLLSLDDECTGLSGSDKALINGIDSLNGESALTAACYNGREEVVHTLLERRADISQPNEKTIPPLLCAVKGGHQTIVELLLDLGTNIEQADQHGRTALMIAASEGHTQIIDMLVTRGASMCASDREGLSSLSWACLKGHLVSIQLMVERGASLHTEDKSGRTPLHLAASFGDAKVVQYLLDSGADLEHTDKQGMRALDRAIILRNPHVVIQFLKKGAKLQASTWTMASDKPDILILLLNKLMEDGNVLYKKERIKDAAHRFQYALKKFPQELSTKDDRGTFKELRVNLLLNLSRCRRKMGDPKGAISLSSKALDLRPKSYEALYARARAKRDLKMYDSGVVDVQDALKLAPTNRELRRLLTRLKDESKSSPATSSANQNGGLKPSTNQKSDSDTLTNRSKDQSSIQRLKSQNSQSTSGSDTDRRSADRASKTPERT